ncbi:hypothetical protein SKAU_G00088090 [Synaphobranchus kaupii]|uniref:Uncharacterized protein n=1 Tax=Synaphobranchus kaupii TaxID=118154 RepID=A0A9Q1FX17_SYNKA|nr:hypothetical protein SKAU_G00088090 [Synaphobranchus kaupii]
MADKQLLTARKEFVDRVSPDIILQLLDDLLDDGVLNDGEKNFVIQKYKSTADQARCLIDKVRKKGRKASEKLISRLLERDFNLYEELNLAPAPAPASQPQLPAPSPSLPQQEACSSPELFLCSEQFKRELLEKDASSIYTPKEKADRKRWALLINNVKFDRKSMLRRGAEKDEESMEKLLKALDYNVEKHKDLSAQAIDEAVKKFSQREEHLQSDSTFVVIMSHGKRDAICGIHYDPDDPASEDHLFSIDNIFEHLNNQNCVGLRGKPKVIVIQACRGDESGSIWVSDSAPKSTSALEDDGIKKTLKEKDFSCLMSCTPGTKSYRDKEKGTLFIQQLVGTINAHAKKDHIVELFRKVMKQFEDSNMQMPSLDRTSMANHFYLFPGL